MMRERERQEKAQSEHEKAIIKKHFKFFQHWEAKFEKNVVSVKAHDSQMMLVNWMEYDVVQSMTWMIGSLFSRRKIIREKLRRQAKLFFNIARAVGKFKRALVRAR